MDLISLCKGKTVESIHFSSEAFSVCSQKMNEKKPCKATSLYNLLTTLFTICFLIVTTYNRTEKRHNLGMEGFTVKILCKSGKATSSMNQSKEELCFNSYLKWCFNNSKIKCFHDFVRFEEQNICINLSIWFKPRIRQVFNLLLSYEQFCFYTVHMHNMIICKWDSTNLDGQLSVLYG